MQELRRIFLFSQLTDSALAELSTALKVRDLDAGQVLFNLGDLGDEMFVIQAGHVGIFVSDSSEAEAESPIRIFAPGETLGEMALIDGSPRSASARALEPSQVLVLTRREFHRLLSNNPDMAISIMSDLSSRIRYNTEFLSQVRDWVKRIAEGNYDREFAPAQGYQDRSVASLAAEFAQMAAQVRQREEDLRREVRELRIKIDESQRQRQVEEIVGSDYFQTLQAKAKNLRRAKSG